MHSITSGSNVTDKLRQYTEIICLVNSIQTVMPRSPLAEETAEAIHTPTTPSDPGQVSGDEEFLTLKFNCSVVMTSGNCLGTFKCNEQTSVGWIRRQLINLFEDMRSKGESDWEDFALLRNEHKLNSDNAKVYEQREVDKQECLLTIVFSSNASNDGHAV